MTTHTPVAELARMTVSELRKELQIKRAELAKMRMGLAMQSEKNSALYKSHKKDVARMTMVLGVLEKKPQVAAPAAVETKKVSKEKPSQAKKKSVKDTGSRSKKA
jgi:ribosomal protein L29